MDLVAFIADTRYYRNLRERDGRGVSKAIRLCVDYTGIPEQMMSAVAYHARVAMMAGTSSIKGGLRDSTVQTARLSTWNEPVVRSKKDGKTMRVRS